MRTELYLLDLLDCQVFKTVGGTLVLVKSLFCIQDMQVQLGSPRTSHVKEAPRENQRLRRLSDFFSGSAGMMLLREVVPII